MATKATTIKVADLAKAVEKAVSISTGKKLPGGIIMGIIVRPDTKLDAADRGAEHHQGSCEIGAWSKADT